MKENKQYLFKKPIIVLVALIILVITVIFPIYSLMILLGAIGTLIMVKKPQLVVKLMIIFIPFNIEFSSGITPSRLLTILSIICLGVFLLIWKGKIKKTPLDLPIFIFLMAVLLSFYKSYDVGLSQRNYITLISLVIRYYTVVILIQNTRHFKEVLNIYFVSVLFAGIFGIMQFIDYEMGLGLGLVNTVDLIGGHLRVTNYFLDSNFYANYLIGSIPLTLSFILNNPIKKSKRLMQILLIITAINVFLTFSRSALVALTVGLFITIVYLNKYLNMKKMIFGTIIILPLIVIIIMNLTVFDSYITRIQMGINDKSISSRLAVLISGLNIIWNNFLFGIGYENAMFNVVNYASPQYPIYEGAIDVHNMHLKVFVETGLIGFLPYSYIWYGTIKRLKKAFIIHTDWYSKAFLQGSIGAIIVVITNGFMLSSLLAIENWVVYLGLSIAYLKLWKQEEYSLHKKGRD